MSQQPDNTKLVKAMDKHVSSLVDKYIWKMVPKQKRQDIVIMRGNLESQLNESKS